MSRAIFKAKALNTEDISHSTVTILRSHLKSSMSLILPELAMN